MVTVLRSHAADLLLCEYTYVVCLSFMCWTVAGIRFGPYGKSFIMIVYHIVNGIHFVNIT